MPPPTPMPTKKKTNQKAAASFFLVAANKTKENTQLVINAEQSEARAPPPFGGAREGEQGRGAGGEGNVRGAALFLPFFPSPPPSPWPPLSSLPIRWCNIRVRVGSPEGGSSGLPFREPHPLALPFPARSLEKKTEEKKKSVGGKKVGR